MTARTADLGGNRLFVAGAVIAGAFVAAGVLAPLVAPYSPIAVDAARMFEPPSAAHLFGTDRFGRDLLSRVLFGIRVSLGIAGLSIGVATLIGGAMGLVAGYFGRGLDQLLGRLMDLLFAFPSLLLALGISAVLGAGATTTTVAIAVVYTPFFFRVMRAAVLAEKNLAYVEAAAAAGAGPGRIIARYLLPNVLAPMLVQVVVGLSYAILIESALSYLGVGVQPPTPSWGTILNEGKEFLLISPWISLFPGLFIMLSVLAFNFVSDGLRDHLDPRLRGA
ncbi:MAG TPA: ABC transporter permease [Thermodesulfobacteriota bacterium]